MTDESQEKNEVINTFDLTSSFSFSLNQRILPHCALSARIQPDQRETLVAVSASNKIIVTNSETTLHIPDKIKCITTVPFGDSHDYIVVGTESQLLVYDFHRNSTIFRRDVPDGVNCFATGKLGDLDRVILCGGNCAIWGFDETGRDVYWTVTGDSVTTMCFCDFDGDEKMELIIGSPDSELRVFKNDLMRAELLETDSVILLQTINKTHFGYALANGTVGVYHKDQRLWRFKSKSIINAILPYPNDEMITCIWNSGKIDVRSIGENGEIVCRNSTLAGQQVISGFTSRINNDNNLEFTVVTIEGKVHGFIHSKSKEALNKTQEALHLFGQKKHNLLVELSNFEQEEQMTEAEKEKDFRIPIGTTVECKLFELYSAEENCYIACINVLRIPETIEGNGDRVQIPIVTEKDMANEIHIRTFLGPKESNKLSVFETTLSIPRFARFCVLQAEVAFIMPTSHVEFILKIRNQRTVIYHDCMETAGNIIQSLCDYFAIESLESQAEFPEKFAEVDEICSELDSMYDVQDRLATDLTEKQALLMEMIVRAEDAIAISDLYVNSDKLCLNPMEIIS
ncbi:hypothetical protein DICVIV_02037 [Dictyocaulus viviparus]|uniref:Bardet-Biedl syndrome 2 protein homolog n=1 Tax=Dictyocaulus viviparus TaxID=29172 RepID=A0A0D8YB08_DICVI|nr:hypothetical protein DICVIV_02037 [Dictyocaulus viviparus]